MTDHSRLPSAPPAAEAARARRASLLERAGGGADWRRLSTPETALPAEPAPLPAPFAPALSTPSAPAPIEAAPPPQVFRGTFHVIDRGHLREQGVIEPEGPVTGLLEELRIIKRQLLLTAAAARGGRGSAYGMRILISSALPGAGKTFCSVNLALSMAAEKDTEVLLVDADFAKPSVLSTLGLPGGPGLLDALSDPRVAVEDCILGTDVSGLFVLPAGNSTGNDTELLASARTAVVLDRLTAHSPNRVVIFDSSPVLAASQAIALAHHVGQTVVVVRADMTGEAALRDAVGLLSGCADIKLLLNAVHFSPSGRRFGTYYGYKE